jgi:hypothetical protein
VVGLVLRGNSLSCFSISGDAPKHKGKSTLG